MANAQIKNLTARALALADYLPTQGASGDAGKNTVAELRDLIRPYKVISGVISFGSLGTPSILQNDFGAVTFSFTNPSNAIIAVTASEATFTADKTHMIGTSIINGSVMYVVTGQPSSTTVFNIVLSQHDNDRTGTPNFSNLFFEIRVYN